MGFGILFICRGFSALRICDKFAFVWILVILDNNLEVFRVADLRIKICGLAKKNAFVQISGTLFNDLRSVRLSDFRTAMCGLPKKSFFVGFGNLVS